MRNSKYSLSGNQLKIIAAVAMLIDHMGLLLFPDLKVFRIIGRLAFPIFAFMISEGCKYTKNKVRYFLNIFVLSLICQTVFYFFDNSLDMCILVTFSLSVVLVYSFNNLKREIFCVNRSIARQCFATLIFVAVTVLVYILNLIFYIDYGFFGCMTPVFASIFGSDRKDFIKYNVLSMGVCLIILSAVLGGVQIYSIFAIPLLLIYSGKRGKYKLKSFFYIFYPLHFMILQVINMFCF